MLPPDFFYPVLRVDAAYSSIGHLDVLCLASLKSIEFLDVSHTNITDEGLAMLCRLPNLQELNIEGCERISIHELERRLAQCRHLKSLTLDAATPEVVVVASTLPRFESLQIGSVESKEVFRSLRKITRLRKLHIYTSEFEDAHLKELLPLSNLRDLSLSETCLTDAGLRQVEQFERLENFNCYGTKVTEDGVARLKDSMPNCNIFSDYTYGAAETDEPE